MRTNHGVAVKFARKNAPQNDVVFTGTKSMPDDENCANFAKKNLKRNSKNIEAILYLMGPKLLNPIDIFCICRERRSINSHDYLPKIASSGMFLSAIRASTSSMVCSFFGCPLDGGCACGCPPAMRFFSNSCMSV